MPYLLPILLLFAFFFAGIVAARWKLIRLSRAVGLLSRIILPALLLVMGYRVGTTLSDGRELARSGLIALIFAVCTVGGTFLATGVLCFLDRKSPDRESLEPGRASAGWKGPLFLLLMVLTGFAAGRLLPIPGFTAEGLTTWLLRLLLFFIGIDMTKSGVSFLSALTGRDTILLPLLTVIGSLSGGLVASLFLDINLWKGLSVASGFGWYTLSGVLITDLGDPQLGSAAFMTNMLREAFAILLIPFLGRTFFARSAVGIAGATSMDVTLPLVERSAGPGMVPLSISHGVILSLLVPLLVPLLYQGG